MAARFEGIRRIGFRRWYERQLIEGHAWLVVCFLAMIMVMAGFELLSMRDGLLEFLSDAALIGGATVLGWFAWRRYARILVVAEFIGEQANCPACAHYGFRCDVAQRGSAPLAARCPKCGHRWQVEQPPDAG